MEWRGGGRIRNSDGCTIAIRLQGFTIRRGVVWRFGLAISPIVRELEE